MCFMLIGDLHQKIHYLSSDDGTERHKFPVDAMKDGLEIVSLTGVLRIEKIKHLFDKGI